MKTKSFMRELAALLIIVIAPMRFVAQTESATRSVPRYRLTDLGTLGGPEGTLSFAAQILNNRGMFAGQMDTALSDSYYPNFNPFIYSYAKPLVQHASLFRDGVLTDLAGPQNLQNSGASWVNGAGHAVGVEENGLIDPFTGYPEVEARLWRNGESVRLGSLGGHETLSVTINDRDQIAGFAANGVPDDLSFFGWGTQMRAFLWDKGTMFDLGTLGGPDAFAAYINDRGQVAGMSYTSYTANPDTGIPTLDPFLWENGVMTHLGSLGGTLTFVGGINNLGSVIGQGYLPGNTESHPILWKDGQTIDLGTFGGTDSEPNWLNSKDEVVGGSNLAGDVRHHGFLWRKGHLIDLGTIAGDKCSTAWSINSRSQVVGASGLCGIAVHAFLWENGKMFDLNRMIPEGVQLTYAVDINDRGEIACLGRTGGDEEHDIRLFLLSPIADGSEVSANAGTRLGTKVSPGALKVQQLRKTGSVRKYSD